MENLVSSRLAEPKRIDVVKICYYLEANLSVIEEIRHSDHLYNKRN